MKPAIEVKNLGKVYRINHEQQAAVGTATFRDALSQVLRKPIELITGHRLSNEEFWALRNINFEVAPGEVVGIIGRNGSGKSTLLKILSQIVDPTEGEVIMRGKVASLLEVGTGFHPDLTGRENIFFNGAILGMSQKEIKSKFHDIVEFSEIEQFLDTPVKFYSSGMYVRLAFAVAAHLDPDILIVDEVLAVGDAAFQKKCLGKMESVAKSGRTVLFVSHNMNAVEQLCKSIIYLESGSLKEQGKKVTKIVQEYLFGSKDQAIEATWQNNGDLNPSLVKPLSIALTDLNGKELKAGLKLHERCKINLNFELAELPSDLQVGYAVYAEDGSVVLWSFHTDKAEKDWPKLKLGKTTLSSVIPCELLNEGQYRVEFLAALYNREWLLAPGGSPAAVQFTIQGGLGSSPYWTTKRPGLLAPAEKWEMLA